MTEGLENTDSGGDRVRSPLPLLVTDEIGGVPVGRRGENTSKIPRFRLYRAAKSRERRRKKGEDCPSEASSAAPDGDRSDEPKSPITAAALLGSFFSLLRRMNK